jgi:hypothetical protein
MRIDLAMFMTFALALAGCGGGGSGGASEPPAAAPAAKEPTLAELCEAHHARERTCVNEYLDALVALRIKVDMPPGIAADAAKRGRDAVLADARERWNQDSRPEVITPMCNKLDTAVPAERVPSLRAQGKRCLDTPDCAAFAACSVEDQRSYIESGDQH